LPANRRYPKIKYLSKSEKELVSCLSSDEKVNKIGITSRLVVVNIEAL
jgi:hypothetical protein